MPQLPRPVAAGTEAATIGATARGLVPSRFALRFAAKEAFSKALGLGFTNGLRFRDIEVVRAPQERPTLSLHRKARDLWESYGLKNSFLSLSDNGSYAVAVVVLEA